MRPCPPVSAPSLMFSEAKRRSERRSGRQTLETSRVVPSSGGDGDDALTVSAATASRLLVFASPIIDEPIAMGGPFVMNTREEIREAFADLRAGRLIQST